MKKKFFLCFFFLLYIILLVSACSNSDNTEKKNLKDTALPEGFTLNNVKVATEEYINYRMWTEPDRLNESISEKSFEPYIHKNISMEVRQYEDVSEKKLYVKANIGEWLLILTTKDGIVYGDGQVSKDERGWPQGNYKVVEDFSVSVKEAQKPNYGNSPRKNKMIAAAEVYLRFVLCEDFPSGAEGEKWLGARVYIADFFEYQDIIMAWIVRKDGLASLFPVGLLEKGNAFEAFGAKGYDLEHVESLDPNNRGRFEFEQQTKDAVLEFTCE
ncbi:hypothetical protein ACFOQM_08005 [Paenibacillus sp. GCM10012307]|uniref:Lipoprotein n=1 Tax=Paenibacillus roseus TaxID=2798579 RepID=A0A934J490_9BACL|nr:hypothetical protein [Paenibacillus roseus]MBJ6361233.1 hypothetical protein [Paenibacillus roseus]